MLVGEVNQQALFARVSTLTGIEPYEVRQVLEADRRWPRPAVDLAGLRVLTIWAQARPVGR